MDLSRFQAKDFNRGAPRWKEALWVAAKCMLFLTPWPVSSRVRASVLRLFGARIGSNVVIRSQLNVWFPWRLDVGDNVWLGEGVMILNLDRVVLEPSVCVSQRAFLCTGSHDYRRDDFALITRPITIRQGSWVAAMAFIGPGVEVGAGSVVAAGSVVFASVPPAVLVKGNPARVVKPVSLDNPSTNRR